MSKKRIIIPIAAVALIVSSASFSLQASADTIAPSSVSSTTSSGSKHHAFHVPGVVGTVEAVNGTNITVAGKNSITYTVDASAAKIIKGAGTTTVSVSNIVVGDHIVVRGTISGTNVAATNIFDGKLPVHPHVSSGNGKSHGPYVFGTVTAVSGTTLTINSKDASNNPITYTIDASAAKIRKGGTSATSTVSVSTIAVGDGVMVRGTVSGTEISATNIIDGMPHTKHIKKTS